MQKNDSTGVFKFLHTLFLSVVLLPFVAYPASSLEEDLLKISKESSILLKDLPTKLLLYEGQEIQGWHEFVKWHKEYHEFIPKIRIPNSGIGYKNILVASIGLVVEETQKKKKGQQTKPNSSLKILPIKIPYYFSSGWEEPSGFKVSFPKDNQPTFDNLPEDIQTVAKEENSNLVKDKNKIQKLIDKANSTPDKENKKATITGLQDKMAQIKKAEIKSIEKYIENRVFDIRNSYKNSDKRRADHCTILTQKLKSQTTKDNVNETLLENLISFIEKPNNTENTHVSDSEQGVFAYLKDFNVTGALFKENLTLDMKKLLSSDRASVKGVILNVVSQNHTCPYCSLFYKLHAASGDIIGCIFDGLRLVIQDPSFTKKQFFHVFVSSSNGPPMEDGIPLEKTVNASKKEISLEDAGIKEDKVPVKTNVENTAIAASSSSPVLTNEGAENIVAATRNVPPESEIKNTSEKDKVPVRIAEEDDTSLTLSPNIVIYKWKQGSKTPTATLSEQSVSSTSKKENDND